MLNYESDHTWHAIGFGMMRLSEGAKNAENMAENKKKWEN